MSVDFSAPHIGSENRAYCITCRDGMALTPVLVQKELEMRH